MKSNNDVSMGTRGGELRGINPDIKRHLEIEIKIHFFKKLQQIQDKLRQPLKSKERQMEEAIALKIKEG